MARSAPKPAWGDQGEVNGDEEDGLPRCMHEQGAAGLTENEDEYDSDGEESDGEESDDEEADGEKAAKRVRDSFMAQHDKKRVRP